MISDDWRTIPGIDPRYEVNSAGQLRSWVPRGMAAREPDQWTDEPRLLKGCTHSDGYRCTSVITLSGRRVTVNFHSLVLAAFIGPLPVGRVTRHLNGDPNDNRLENLTYGTHLENHADRDLHGRTARGDTHGRRKTNSHDVLTIISRYKAGETQMAIAKSMNLGQTTVSDIVSGRTWSEVTGIR